jgi:type II secretory pathway pseudopilin PulG
MFTDAQREYAAVAILLTIFVAALIPSLLTARASVRDGLRKQDLTYLKRSLEQFYNEHEYYPALAGTNCLTTNRPDRWPFIETLPHDVRETAGFIYRYCVTESDNAGATGYFLEARLEVDQPDQRTFDEDELRKFYFRILHQDGQTLYRVCGGEEKQCEP